jgi:hypothetical protein
MVIRAPADAVDLRCGGVPMVDVNSDTPAGVALDPGFAGGALIGKRYIDAADKLELLCTKGGRGSLSTGADMLDVKQAKALPSSD